MQLCFAVEELTMAKLVVEVEEISVLAWLGGGCERERERVATRAVVRERARRR